MVDFGQKVSEDEVLGYWLRYEFKSRQSFKSRIDQDLIPFIERDDYDNREANYYRYSILWGLYRGGLLRWLPARDDIEWHLATIDEVDYASFLLIGSEEWRSLTDGTGNIPVCARRIIAEQENLRKDKRYSYHVETILDLLARIESGSNIDSRLILFGKKAGPFTVIDGVHRSVALFIYYFLKKSEKFVPHSVYIGISEKISNWQIRA